MTGVVCSLLVAASALAAGPILTAQKPPLAAARTPDADLEHAFAGSTPLDLPVATAAPAPAPPQVSDTTLAPHEVFAFAPWWNLADEDGFDVRDLTTLAYFSVDVNPDGSIDESDSGWDGYESQDLVDLVNRAHAADDRVVLTVTCFDQNALDQLTSDPSAPGRLGAALVQLISAKNLDGVNFDLEGNGAQDRQGLDDLIAAVSGQLRAADPNWQITMSTYASSAGDPQGFFDIAGLARSVDAFFVMAYDMNDPSTPSATAPLGGPGNNDAVDLAEYSAVVPRSKIILGVPYYGYAWPTTGPGLGAPSTGPAAPVSYAQLTAQMAAGHLPSYWDPTTETPWTAYQSGSQWYQAFYDDPTSLALKAHLADKDGILGVGVWALGMDGDDPAMLAALLGNAAPTKYAASPVAKAAGSTTSAPGATTGSPTYSYSGTWNGTSETLSPVQGSLPGNGEAHSAGQLTSFSTDNPAYSCLSDAGTLPVYELESSPTTYVVQVSAPSYCASGTWEFSAPAQAGDAGSPGSSSTTTTTTSPPPGSPPITVPVLGTAPGSKAGPPAQVAGTGGSGLSRASAAGAL